MDKSWINYKTVSDRRKPNYRKGVIEFLDFAFSKVGNGDKIRCPCNNCNNIFFQDRELIFNHLIIYGILRDYKQWIFHGEEENDSTSDEEHDDDGKESGDNDFEYDDTISLIHDATNVRNVDFSKDVDHLGDETDQNDAVPENFYRLMKDAEQELFSGCDRFTKLEFILHLLHLKCINGWSDKSFSMLLNLLKSVFFHDSNFPSNSYEAKKYTRDLGLDYVKIDVCKNDCILYRNVYEKYQNCPICGCSRWKIDNDEGKKVPHKILRHFPLIPRLQRFYMSSKLASHMRWHKEKRPDDGVLRHPADSKAWKSFDEMYPNFALDSRNVRLGLASDGFNPFGNLSTSYSIWPVILVPYNLPPWICMKSEYFILSLLIPGPKAPGNDIDVFLEPLIDELMELWYAGVETYDAFSSNNFKLHASLLWTINDFPAYANLSGWSTKGKLACPNCNVDTSSYRLSHGHKLCYMCHRRFLDANHKWRFDKKSFDGTIEMRNAPKLFSGDDVLDQLSGCDNVIFGKVGTKRKQREHTLKYNWKKKSIFFKLPYWSKVLVRHNLDVMHIEKNVCESIIGTVLGIDGKTKDNLNSRLDLRNMGIRKDLHPIELGDKYLIPKAAYSLTLKEKRVVCKFLENLKVPDGYSSNISRCVNYVDGKVLGMKSHDYHVFMQDLIAPVFRGILPTEVYEPLAELGVFFKQLCEKTLRVDALEKLERNIILTLCKMERIFPPSFFDIMLHLPIHLASEAKVAGPVQYRWMYPFER